MALENWTVQRVKRNEVADFIERWHYSGSINGCIADFCYALFDESGFMKGAMFYGRMAMANQFKRFADKESDVIELRRLCCVDDTPKNAESFLIGRSLRDLKKQWEGKIVVSYADKEHNHSGTIYKASNFRQVGDIKGAKIIVHNNRHYHDKSIRTKYKGKLKPFAQRLLDALNSGEAFYKETAGKHTYLYTLR